MARKHQQPTQEVVNLCVGFNEAVKSLDSNLYSAINRVAVKQPADDPVAQANEYAKAIIDISAVAGWDSIQGGLPSNLKSSEVIRPLIKPLGRAGAPMLARLLKRTSGLNP